MQVLLKKNKIPVLLIQQDKTAYQLAKAVKPYLSQNQVYAIVGNPFIPGRTTITTMSLLANALSANIEDLYEEIEVQEVGG